MHVDVVIIGAGLAGVSAALEIASRSRAEVILVERRTVGSNNPTPMTFADVPARFGIADYVLAHYRSFAFHSPLGGESLHQFDQPALVALDYQASCRALLERASLAGNVWLYSAAALRLARRDKSWLVELNDGRELDAPLVIDASGRGLFSARQLGLPAPKSYSHCYGARLSNVAVPDPQQAVFLAPDSNYGDGGGWLYPLAGGQASFGYATLGNTPALPGRLVKERFQRALAEFQPYASWLQDAVWEHVETGTIPLYPLRRLVYDGLLIAGDAAGQATIWSCMGSEAALEAGQMAGAAALRALETSNYSAVSLYPYQTAWDRLHRRIYRNNAWIAPAVWGMSPEVWNRQIPLVQTLTPEQMIARLRINWPVPTLPQAAFVRAYDLAGRARRGLLRRWRARRPGSKNNTPAATGKTT